MPSPSIQTNPAATPRKLRRESGSSAGPESQPSPTSQPTVKQAQSQPGKQSQDAGSGLASRSSNTANESAGQASHTLANTTKVGQGTVPEDQLLDVLSGLEISGNGQVLGEQGNPLGRVTEGDPGALAGRTVADNGNVLDENGQLIGRVEALPDAAQAPANQAKGTASDLADLASRPVSDGGLIKDKVGQAVGKVVEGDAQDLVGYSPNSNGEILDDDGDLVGRVEPVPNAQYAADGTNAGDAAANGAASPTNEIKHGAEGNLDEDRVPLSKLEGLQCNKMGKIIGSTGNPVGELIEGDPKRLAQLGATLDDAGQFWDNRGNVIGKAQPAADQDAGSNAPFAGLDGLHVVNDGWVEDNRGMRVGKIVEGEPKKLLGREVDIDGDVVDQHGSTVARAEPWEAPDDPETNLSALDGKVVNKAGNVVDAQGNVFGRVTSGDARMAGRKVDGKGQVWGDNGQVIGQAELIPGAEVQRPEGPFFGFDNAVVAKDGVVVSGDGIIGRVLDGDAKRLQGRQVDEDGDIQDKNGNTVGRAERWEPEEKPRRISPMSGRKVTREGEVRDADGNLIGKLTSGNLGALVGQEIDDNGYVVDNDGNKVGECVLLENIPGPSPEELEAQKREDADRELATKMSRIVGQTLDRVRPICKMVSEVCLPSRSVCVCVYAS